MLLSIKFPAILRKLKKHLAKLIVILFGGGGVIIFPSMLISMNKNAYRYCIDRYLFKIGMCLLVFMPIIVIGI